MKQCPRCEVHSYECFSSHSYCSSCNFYEVPNVESTFDHLLSELIRFEQIVEKQIQEKLYIQPAEVVA